MCTLLTYRRNKCYLIGSFEGLASVPWLDAPSISTSLSVR